MHYRAGVGLVSLFLILVGGYAEIPGAFHTLHGAARLERILRHSSNRAHENLEVRWKTGFGCRGGSMLLWDGNHRSLSDSMPLFLRGGQAVEEGGQGGGYEGKSGGFLGRLPIAQMIAEADSLLGKKVCVCGWARTVRIQGAGSFAFLEVNDGSCFKSLQVIVDKGLPGWEDVLSNPHTHTSWRIEGELVQSPGKGQAYELKATSARLLGASPPESYSLAKGRMPLDFLRGLPHLRCRTNTIGAVARVRNALTQALHSYFQDKGFVQVHTPLITASDCEGAGQLFGVTTILPHLDKFYNTSSRKVDYSNDFFKRPAFLTCSGQLQAEAYALSLGNVYTFGPTFRAEESHTTRHLAEFWMLEPEMAFADLGDAMDCAEGMLKSVLTDLLKALPEDMDFFEQACTKGVAGFTKGTLIDRLQTVIDTPFSRVSYTEAVRRLLESKQKFEVKIEWGSDLATEHERYLTENIYQGPVIVYDYPKGIKAFYMRSNEDGKTVAAMDVLFPKCGEIVGGSQREERITLLEQRAAQSGIDANSPGMSWYMDLRKFGGVPHAGFGLGFERLVMFATGLENIRDTIPFPRFPAHALC